MRWSAVPVPSGVWVQGVTGARHQCTCEGACGVVHPSGRCDATSLGRSLVVCPRDVNVPPVSVEGAPVSWLTARCVPCADGIAWLARPRRPRSAPVPTREAQS